MGYHAPHARLNRSPTRRIPGRVFSVGSLGAKNPVVSETRYLWAFMRYIDGRREFIKALGVVGVVASATVVRGQQSAAPLIGFLSSRSPGESASLVDAFR